MLGIVIGIIVVGLVLAAILWFLDFSGSDRRERGHIRALRESSRLNLDAQRAMHEMLQEAVRSNLQHQATDYVDYPDPNDPKGDL